MPNNLKVLNSIHENMLPRNIPPGSLQFTSTNPVEFLAAVNGFRDSSPCDFSEKMAKSLIAQSSSVLEFKATLCASVADVIVGDDNIKSPKDTQIYWNHFPEGAVRETQQKATRNSGNSWRDIDLNSCLELQSSLPQTTPIAGFKNHLNTQHGIFEMHNITIVQDKPDTSLVGIERAQPVTEAGTLLPHGNDHKLPLLKLSFSTGEKGEGFGEFEEPVGVTSNQKGEIIVTDYNNDRLQVLSGEGEIIRVHDHYSRQSGKQFPFMSPAGIACDPAGNMVVVEKARNRVVVLSPTGVILHAFGRRGKEQGQFRGPHGVSVDARRRIIVTDTINSRVQVFDHEGNFLFMFGNKGPGKLNYPCYAIFHAGRFYVADTDNDSVKVFDTRGTFVRTLGDDFNAPSGIAVYKDKYLLVCDYSNDCVKVFSLDGRLLNKIGTSGTGSGQFCGPEALAVSPEGKIIVTDKLNCRLHIIDVAH